MLMLLGKGSLMKARKAKVFGSGISHHTILWVVVIMPLSLQEDFIKLERFCIGKYKEIIVLLSQWSCIPNIKMYKVYSLF
jgi:hypothetical protein